MTARAQHSLGDIKNDICSGVKAELSASGIPVAECRKRPDNCAVQASSPTTITITCKKPDRDGVSTAYDTDAVAGSTAIVEVKYNHTLITPVHQFPAVGSFREAAGTEHADEGRGEIGRGI